VHELADDDAAEADGVMPDDQRLSWSYAAGGYGQVLARDARSGEITRVL
jgi:hypothetical protein